MLQQGRDQVDFVLVFLGNGVGIFDLVDTGSMGKENEGASFTIGVELDDKESMGVVDSDSSGMIRLSLKDFVVSGGVLRGGILGL